VEELRRGYLKLSHLSKYADLSVTTLRGMLKEGLPYFKLEGLILVKLEDFDEYVERFKIGRSADDIVEEMLGQDVHKT
jgi:hypothetical protein